MKGFSKHIIAAMLIFFSLAALFSLFNGRFERAPVVPLSRLVEQIRANEVARIVVEGDDLTVMLADGTIEKSKKETETSFSETLRNYTLAPESLHALSVEVKNPSGILFWLGNILPFALPILFIVFFFWLATRQMRRANFQALNFGQSKARLVGPESVKDRVKFSDVAGAREAKEELAEVVDFLKSPQKFLAIGARIPKGVLLMGAPGTGKTLLARAVAGEAGVPFFHISGSEFVEMFVGVGASRVRDLFRTAKKAAPAILFVDEIDAVGRQRGAGLGGGHDEREQTLNQILVEMDGFEPHESVIIIAATNRPDVLDPALLRPGRFDRRIVLDLPDLNDREQILTIHARRKALEKSVNLRRVAERTPGFSGADLQNLMNEGAILAARNNRKTIAQNDLINAMEKVLLGPERKSHILSETEKNISAYHEAGHALVAAASPNADPVHKISIVARGRAAGYTLKLPLEDRHLYTRSHFLDELAVSLGGYASEKVVFNELTTGAADDLRKATDIARSLVTRFGMSDKIGPVAFGEKEELIFLGREFGSERNYSESIATIVDEEIGKFMKSAYKKAAAIIKKYRPVLDEIARRLIQKESIERDEFDELVQSFGLPAKAAVPVRVSSVR